MTEYFITIAFIKNNTILDSNIDDKLIRPVLMRVQDMHLQDILGTDLYLDINSQIDGLPNGGNMSAKYKSLMADYIKPYLLNAVVGFGLCDLYMKVRNKSVMTQNSENAQPVTLQDLQRMEQDYKTYADYYAQKISDYLCANATTYPLYNNGNSEKYKTKPKHDQYSTGIFTGNRRHDYRDKRYRNER